MIQLIHCKVIYTNHITKARFNICGCKGMIAGHNIIDELKTIIEFIPLQNTNFAILRIMMLHIGAKTNPRYNKP